MIDLLVAHLTLGIFTSYFCRKAISAYSPRQMVLIYTAVISLWPVFWLYILLNL